MVEVDSSMITSIGYEDDSSKMTIVFKNGYVYDFHMIPRTIFEEFVAADSKGTFFMEKLKFSPYGRRISRAK